MTEEIQLSTGYTVRVKPVSPILRNKIVQAVPAPEPPLMEVDYGEGEKRMEANPNDPAFLQEFQAWRQKKNERYHMITLKLGVECAIDQETLAIVREIAAAEGVQLEDDDKIAFLLNIAIGCEEDYARLFDSIQGKSQPAEAAIQAAADSFRGDVQRSSTNGVEDTTVEA